MTMTLAEALAALGVQRHETLRVDVAALSALLDGHTPALQAAAAIIEEELGGLLGPGGGPAQPLDFDARGQGLWAAVGPGLFAMRRIRQPAFGAGSVLVARLLPLPTFWDGAPVHAEAPDRKVVAGGTDDVGLEPSGALLCHGVSTGHRVVRISMPSEEFFARLAWLLEPPARGWPHVRLRLDSRCDTAALAGRLGLEQGPGGFRDADMIVVEGDWLEPQADGAMIAAASLERLAHAVEVLAGNRMRLEGRLGELRVRSPRAAPASREREARCVACQQAEAIVDEQHFEGRIVIIDRFDRRTFSREAYLAADESIAAGLLSERCRTWMREHGVQRDPRRIGRPEALSRALSALEPALLAAVQSFEARYGGLCLEDATESYWLSVQASLRAGHRVRDGCVPIGAFAGGGIYRIDSAGRIWADDNVVDIVRIASSARHLIERFVIGERHPESVFVWPGRHRYAIETPFAESLAQQLGATPIPELSDEVERVYVADDLAIWEPPLWAEMSQPFPIAVCDSEKSVSRLEAALEALGGTATSLTAPRSR